MSRFWTISVAMVLPLAALAAAAGRLGLYSTAGFVCFVGAANGVVAIWLLQRRLLPPDDLSFHLALQRLPHTAAGAGNLQNALGLLNDFAREHLHSDKVIIAS